MMKPRNGSQQSGTFKINQFLSVWGLALAIALGAILRFWNLDLKPLWMDEAITLLFALGRRYEDLPREVLIPLQNWLSVLDWQPQSCAAIAQTVNQQSTHPPLFFCAMHQWMGWWHQSGMELRWQVRSLSALAGTGAIAAMYLVNRVAFSHRAGLWAAGLMAVSPFAVYLSQEGRHYTLPMLIIALSLIPTVQLGTARTNRDRLIPLLAWVGLSSLGFYVHYFCLLAFGAEALALAAVLWRQRSALGVVALGIVGIGLSLWPWMPQLLAHTQRPETDWLQFNAALGLSWLEPLLRLLAGCIVTVVMFPVENQPLPIVILNGLLMLGFVVYLCTTLWRHRRKLFSLSQRPCSAQVLSYVLLAYVGEYWVLVYGLHKDLTLAFRYNFVFYPVLCALLAASLVELTSLPLKHRLGAVLPWVAIAVGLVSSGFVTADLAFAKPFAPQQVAARFMMQPSQANLAVIKHYRGWQDAALGLSFALATQQVQVQTNDSRPIFWGLAKANNAEDVIKLYRRSPFSLLKHSEPDDSPQQTSRTQSRSFVTTSIDPPLPLPGGDLSHVTSQLNSSLLVESKTQPYPYSSPLGRGARRAGWVQQTASQPRSETPQTPHATGLKLPATVWQVGNLGITKPPLPQRIVLKEIAANQETTSNCIADRPSVSEMGVVYQRYDCPAR